MRIMIFCDRDNFDGSLATINKKRDYKDRRFWKIDKCIKVILEKNK